MQEMIKEALLPLKKYLSTRTCIIFGLWILIGVGLMGMAKFNTDYDYDLANIYFFAANVEVFLGGVMLALSILIDAIFGIRKEQIQFKEEVMDIIGKKVTLQIGGEAPKKNPNEIVGSETIVHVTEEEAAKGGNIIGEKIELKVGSEKKKQD